MSSSIPNEKRGIALNFKNYMHHTEHLAAVCCMMDIPLLTTEELETRFVETYYPETKIIYKPRNEVNAEYIYNNYDVMFSSDYFDLRHMNGVFGKLEAQHGKIMRHIYCSHGCSDKAFWFEECAREDMYLVYGDQMLDMLELCHVPISKENYVVTGNYRYSYYMQNQAFFDDMVLQQVLSKLPNKNKTILYAPTFYDWIASTSFHDAFPSIIKNLPDEYNLIVKFHPLMVMRGDPQERELIEIAKNKPNILLVWNYPYVFPFLNFADIYIGDSSSIGYDFLMFRKPMFFLNQLNQSKDEIAILNCGRVIHPHDYSKVYFIIEKSLKTDHERYDKKRQQVCKYAFGELRSFSDIRKDVVELYNKKGR